MARSVNKVILIGNLGQDPELRYTGSGVAVCTMRLATNESYRDQDGQLVERTEWHNVVAWSRLAETCGEYLKKGSRLYFEGSLQTRSWEDRDGNTRYTTEVKVRDMMMLDGRESGIDRTDTAANRHRSEHDRTDTAPNRHRSEHARAGHSPDAKGHTRKTPKISSARKTQKISSARKTPKISSARKTPKTSSARKTPKTSSARKTPKISSATTYHASSCSSRPVRMRRSGRHTALPETTRFDPRHAPGKTTGW